MIIKKIAFGNIEEAFLELRLKNKTNIIFSNNNNRGKTLVLQGLMYSIGYESIFPSGFDHKKYYFYSEIEINGKIYEFLRKGNSIILLEKENINIFDSISEFKYHFNKHIHELPKIEKDEKLKVVDLSLFFEIFFLGQDKRNSSNLISKGASNKEDFKNMIFAMQDAQPLISNIEELKKLKKKKKNLEVKIKSEQRRVKILNDNPEIASYVSSAADNIEFKKFSKELSENHQRITELKKSRNREENRKYKLENLINELNSLNLSLNQGKVKCLDCGGARIIFANQDFEFEASNIYVRKNVINSIKENISVKEEIIFELDKEIKKEQSQIKNLLKDTSPELGDYILFQKEILSSDDVDKIISDLQEKINGVQIEIESYNTELDTNKKDQKQILKKIIKEMQRYYEIVDKDGLLHFEDLFTKSAENHSGSDEQEYYFCKLLGISNVTGHNFPIIVDSFREGEISTGKEELMIKEYLKLDKQVILTSTLKDEEYGTDKYEKMEKIHSIDYSGFEDSKILQEVYVNSFNEILTKFNIHL